VSITIPQKKKLSYGWVVVATSFITCTVVFGIQYSFGIFFTSFQEAFGWSRATTSMVMTIHLSVFALCMVPVGWAIDRFNVRMLFSIAAILVGLAMVLCSHISQLWQIYVFYGLLMGVGVSMFGPVIMTIVTHWFTKRRGLALGIASAGVGFGTLVGAPLSHFLIATYGWRDSFTILGVFGGIILLICAQFMRRAPLPVGNDTTTTLPESTLHKKEHYASKGMPLIQALKTRDILLILTAQIFIGFTVRSVMVHIAPHAIE
jgi:MFS family permease